MAYRTAQKIWFSVLGLMLVIIDSTYHHATIQANKLNSIFNIHQMD